MNDHAITLHLTEPEKAALQDLATAKDLSEKAVLRQALRLYQLVCARQSEGETFSFSGDAERAREFSGKPKPQARFGSGKCGIVIADDFNDPVYQEIGSPSPTAQRALVRALASHMSEISEDLFCAGWAGGLEYTLWEAVQTGRLPLTGEYPHFDLSELDELRALSDLLGGWVVWDGVTSGSGRQFVPLAEWRERFGRWKDGKEGEG